MVEADPDVPDPFAEVVKELRQRRRFAGLEGEPRPFGRQDGRLRRAAALEAQQAAVGGIEVEEQAVGDLERDGRGGGPTPWCAAVGVESHDRVGAVAVLVHQKILGGKTTGLLI